jgi:hypothetical protein
MLFAQVIVNGAQLRLRDPAELARTLRLLRPELRVGLLSVAGSLGWALAPRSADPVLSAQDERRLDVG